MSRNICQNLSGKYNPKLLDSAKQSATDAIKTASKRATQKAAETTSDLVGNKIADKINKNLTIFDKVQRQLKV